MKPVKREGTLKPPVLSNFFDSDRFFSDPFFTREWTPAVNIKENTKDFKIEVAIPGMSKENFNINIDNDTLTISAEKEDEKNEKDERYTRKEYSYGSFVRSFRLPENSKPEDIVAKYEDGILKLEIPKKEESKVSSKRKVKVS